jgi:hypothetical protein
MNGYAVRDSGIVLLTTDSGINWTREYSNTTAALRGVYEAGPFGQETLWTCGVGGEILLSVNEGAEWSPFPSPVSSDLRAVSFGTPHNGVKALAGFIVGDDGVIIRLGSTTGIFPHTGSTLPGFTLEQNYPNPFNPLTVIRYFLPAGQAGLNVNSYLTLKVYNDIGQEVATLVDGEESDGVHVAKWDAGNAASGTSSGGGYASGVYFYRLSVGGRVVSTLKANLVK